MNPEENKRMFALSCIVADKKKAVALMSLLNS